MSSVKPMTMTSWQPTIQLTFNSGAVLYIPDNVEIDRAN